MILGWNDIKKRALAFSKKYKDARDEFAEAQSFLNDFFDVFGVDRKRVATFETKVTMGTKKNGYIDLLWKGVILVEMKSTGKDLDKAHKQANDYAFRLEDEDLPDYIMVSDFKNIKLYRLSTNQEWVIKLSELHKKVKLFSALAGYKDTTDLPMNKEVDIKAAEKMAKLHDVLKEHGYEGHELEVYLVRLLFCLFADDTGIFEPNIFYEYISKSKQDGSDLSYRLAKLFEVLDTPPDQREKQLMLSDELKRFAYINGSLFSERLSFADFNISMRKMLLDSATLDWSFISPAIFGSIFQGVMNPVERRALGAHYTSEENIMKLIRPLFLDSLWEEFERIKGNSKQLMQFHEKLGRLKFLDPACGCGNFLIITYREIRLLELEVLKMLIDTGGQIVFDYKLADQCKVNVNQFYGIEYEDFPSQIAQVGMWLVDHQMNMLVAEHFGLYFARLPLRKSATIIHGNALRMDWEDVVPKDELSFILGNPPFIGFTYMNDEQKADMAKYSKSKSLDYVCTWYLKGGEFIKSTNIKMAFVSTNSITQGEPVSILWEHMLTKKGLEIFFAYRTFVWNNEAKGKAAVHCVIIGVADKGTVRTKYIYDNSNKISANNINPYLVDAPNVIIKSRNTPICNVPAMRYGNKIIDDGNLIIEANEYQDFIESEPQAAKYIKKFVGAREFINKLDRFILNLQDADPTELRQCPKVMERVNKVREFRLGSVAEAIRKKASTPMLFGQITNPNSDYLLVPRVSSQKRAYVPIDFVDQDVVASDAVQIIPKATVYDFGVLTSNVHMAWMRAICGRMKSDYRYGKDVVYNNFPWPTTTDQQKINIEIAANKVLDARALYFDSSLADLYDPLTMPQELVSAHSELDRAVMRAYGYRSNILEEDIVADLFKRYQILLEGKE